MSSNFKKALEFIGQAVFELLPPEDPENDEAIEALNNLLGAVEEGYCLIQWPESQDFMEEDWFEEEAILYQANDQEHLDSAYFIPLKRLI